MQIAETLIWEGRALTVEWLLAPFRPPRKSVTQVSGVCFTGSGKVVLAAGQLGTWALPGGHVERGESLEQTLAREVKEEACAVVKRAAYLGAQKVSDPDNPTGSCEYYQARFWARVELQRFEPRHERTQRTLVAPSQFVSALGWQTGRIAQATLDAALAAERRYKSRVLARRRRRA
jgi:ADP-ribose pyrophosphatase YjhB (NUDIX family)